MRRKSTSQLDINTKIENLESLSLPGDAEGADIKFAEGSPMQLNSDGTKFIPLGGDTGQVAFVNFVDEDRADAKMLQGDPFQGQLAARSTEGGRLTGIRGNGVVIGVPLWLFDTTVSVGDGVGADATTVSVDGQDYAGWTTKTSNFTLTQGGTAGLAVYGQVERIANGKAYFAFFGLPSITSA